MLHSIFNFELTYRHLPALTWPLQPALLLRLLFSRRFIENFSLYPSTR